MTNPNVDALGQIAMSAHLAATLARASHHASSGGYHEVTIEHMLLAMIEDPDAAQIFAASNVDSRRLATVVADHIGQAGGHRLPEGANVTFSPGLQRILAAAATAAQQGRKSEVSGAIVLAAIVGEGESAAAQFLRAQGLTFDAAIRALQIAARAAAAQAPEGAPLPASGDTVRRPASTLPPGTPAQDVLAAARERVELRAPPAPPQRSAAAPVPDPQLEDLLEPSPPPPPSSGSPREDSPAAPAPGAPAQAAPANVDGSSAFKTQPEREREDFHLGKEEGRNTHLSPPPPPPPPPAAFPAGEDTPPFIEAPATGGLQAGTAGFDAAARSQSFREAPSLEIPGAVPGGERARRSPEMRREPAAGELRAVPSQRPPTASRPAPPGRGRASLQGAVTGPLSCKVPRRMRAGTPATVEATLSKAAVAALVGDGGAGAQEGVTRAVSLRLRALPGEFWSETLSSETQWIEPASEMAASETAKWQWTVLPRRWGRKRLQFVLSIRTVTAAGLAPEKALPIQEAIVRVSPDFGPALRTLLGWALAAGTGALAMAFGGPLWEAAQVLISKLLAGAGP